MPIDTSMYNALIRPRSVQEYAQGYADQDLRQQTRQANALALQAGQQKADEYGRGVREQETVRNALMGMGANATDDQRINTLRGTGTQYGYSQADALQKTLIEQQKAQGQAYKDRADAAAKNGGLLKQYSGILVQSPTQATAASLLNHYEQTTGERADNIRAILEQAGDNPEALRRIGAALAVEAEKLLPKTQNINAGNAYVQQAVDPITGVATQTGSTPILQSADNRATQATAAARLGEDRRQFGITQAAAGEQRAFERAKPVGGNSKTGPMSVTLQKELLESDDTVQSSASVIRALQAAKKQNEAAYSGYLAKPRATLRSNLPGDSESADATIDIDNLMTGQGLDQMKSIFGAAPTEGERKILLEMQASVDKTPKQREAIMDRAISAAARRAEYATKKAKSIRDGSYLTDGVPESGGGGSGVVDWGSLK